MNGSGSRRVIATESRRGSAGGAGRSDEIIRGRESRRGGATEARCGGTNDARRSNGIIRGTGKEGFDN